MEIQFGDAASHAQALQEIVAAENGDSELQVLHGGEFSSVIRVKDVVYKSPHSGVDDNSSVVRFDAAVAAALPATANLATGSEVLLPQLVATRPDENPPLNMLRFVPGDILTIPAIAQFNPAAKVRLGKDLGSFAVWLDKTIPATMLEAIRTSTPVTPLTLLGVLEDFRLPYLKTIREAGCHTTADTLEELVSSPLPAYQNIESEPFITSHGDLRPANFTLENGRLKGVFDFGNITRSDPAEELRFTYFMGGIVAKAAIQQFYDETQIMIPEQRVAHYASAQVMLSATFCAIYGTEVAGGFSPSHRNFLHQYYPDRDWSELDRFSEASSKA